MRPTSDLIAEVRSAIAKAEPAYENCRATMGRWADEPGYCSACDLHSCATGWLNELCDHIEQVFVGKLAPTTDERITLLRRMLTEQLRELDEQKKENNRLLCILSRLKTTLETVS